MSWLLTPALAVAYYVAGWIGLLLAIDPIHHTAIWLPAGLALACLLVYGRRAWPGLLAGAFSIHLHLAVASGAGAFPGAPILLAAVQAVAALLQAELGARLVRSTVGFPSPLDESRQILLFLLVGGPVSCLLGATVATLSERTFAAEAQGALATSWLVHWVGAVIGVLTLTPIVLAFIAKPRSPWRHRRIAANLPLAITFAVVSAFFLQAKSLEQGRIRQEFERRALEIQTALEADLGAYVEILRSIESLYMSSREVERHEFRAFVERILDRHPGIQALGWAPRVDGGEREAFVERTRSSWRRDYEIRERQADGSMVVAEPRDEYFPVLFVEREEGNQPAIGFDLASEPNREKARRRSDSTGQPEATAPVSLVQEAEEPMGFLVFLPIFAALPSDATAVEEPALARGRASPLEPAVGFVVGVFRTGQVIDIALEGVPRDGVHIEVADVDPLASQTVHLSYIAPDVGGRQAMQEHGYSESAFHRSENLTVAGRTWRLNMWASADFELAHRSWVAWAVLVIGLLFMAVLGYMLLLMTGRTARVEQLVAQRTAALTSANISLQRTAEALKQADQIKSEFLASMSHELRTPLNSVIGFSKVLLKNASGSLSSREIDFVRRIEANGRHLLNLVNDILDISKVESGHLDLAPEEVDVGAVVRSVVEEFEEEARGQGILLRRKVPGRLAPVRADPLRLRQVLLNLVENAVKFTCEGSIEVAVTRHERTHAPASIVVRDTGIGIPPDRLEKIFEAFQQGDARTSQRYGGTGLGLSISRALCQLMGFELTVASKPGKGSTFTVLLAPFEPQAPRPQAEPPSHAARAAAGGPEGSSSRTG